MSIGRSSIANDEDGFYDRLLTTWWGRIVFGLICFGFALVNYLYFSWVESQRTPVALWWFLAIVYDLLGKMGTVWLFLIPGVVLVILGVLKYFFPDSV